MSKMSSLLSPTVSHGRARLAALALLLGFVLEMLFMASYTGALHNPDRTPRGLPLAVAGPASLADRYVNALNASAPRGAFKITREGSPSAARLAVEHRDVFAALTPTPSGGTRLIVADAAGVNVASQLSSKLSAAFHARGERLQVEHVAKLSSGDPRGISPFYAALSWVFGGYVGAIVLSVLAGAATSRRLLAWQRLGGLAVFALASGIVGAIVLGPVLGALTGHFVALAALGTAIVFSVSVITLGLQAMLGVAGTAIALLLFLIASNPSSGGPVVGPSLPPFWRIIGPWLPTGAGTTSLRNTVYFDSAHLVQPLLVLAGFAIVGIVLTLLGAARQSHRQPSTGAPASATDLPRTIRRRSPGSDPDVRRAAQAGSPQASRG